MKESRIQKLNPRVGEKAPRWNGGKANRECKICRKQFMVWPSVVRSGGGTFCSRTCTMKDPDRNVKSVEKLNLKCLVCSKSFQFYKCALNKSKKAGLYCSLKCRGIKQAEIYSGNNAHKWLGKKVGYSGGHSRVKKLLGTPKKCTHCNTTTARKFEWASINKKYWDTNDYVRLCTKCHRRFDNAKRKNHTS